MLTGLSDGTHYLTIYGETAISGLTGNFNATVTFEVDTLTPPTSDSFPNRHCYPCCNNSRGSSCWFAGLPQETPTEIRR